jgi:hypothetical protein
MKSIRLPIKSARASAAAKASAVAAASAVLAAVGLTAGFGATASAATGAATAKSFSFALDPSAAVTTCLPHAKGHVTITPNKLNDIMKVSVSGMPPNAGFDLFVIQQPTAPFGVAWYQTDVQANAYGDGSATVQGVFDVETFSVSLGGTTTFSPTHQYHLGLWFNNPETPFKLGCEPGATTPTVTPFNGEQHAGIQVLNTAEFPVNAGPLSHVKR